MIYVIWDQTLACFANKNYENNYNRDSRLNMLKG